VYKQQPTEYWEVVIPGGAITSLKKVHEYYERIKQEILVESDPDLSFIQHNAIAKVTSEYQEINLQDRTSEGFIAWLQDYCQHKSGFISTNKGQNVLLYCAFDRRPFSG
jgi:hypothetical protein